VLGPDGLGFVQDADRILGAAEIGVVMLLFVIGLELSPARLKVMRRSVFGAGAAQVALSGLVLGGLLLLDRAVQAIKEGAAVQQLCRAGRCHLGVGVLLGIAA
ncbi:cation:proton antiporter, partial [Mesorhizobium sp. M8A.F.Ca.ET.142.01.1.1]|uniref:cation:proton antiporter domain-containing protein n=1 Tax=Mesorhizobium sp. M8A.F.Ca.ET.142.01.1.1 TaxID=2563958 RepID=UPI001AEF1EBF